MPKGGGANEPAKDYLANRWRASSGPAQIHFSRELDEGFYRQITAEYRVSIWRNGHRHSRWDKKQADRNEALDLFVYNTAAAHYLGLNKLSDAHWDKLIDRLNPDQAGLFAFTTEEKDTKTDPTQRQAVTDSYKKTTAPLTPAAAPATPPRTRPQGQGRDW